MEGIGEHKDENKYITEKDYKVLFKVWDSLGVNFKNTQYLGKKFRTMDDYHHAVLEYNGITQDGDGLSLNRAIIDTANEYLSDVSNLSCPKGSIKMYHVDFGYDRQLSSPSVMTNWYDGMGSNPFGNFVYDKDPDFICKDINNSIYQLEYDPESVCYDDECLSDNISEVGNIIYKKYGIRMNSSYDDKGNKELSNFFDREMGRW